MIKTLEYIWITLLALTTFAYLLGYLEYVNSLLVAVLLLTTFIKGTLVSDYLMDLKEVRLKYRLVPMIWLSSVLFLIGVAYYMPVA